MSTPVFVVVGNVNQGKSSVVAALTENEAIPIDRYPGTTRRSGNYLFKLGDRELFRIVDTPGFQDARAALAWLKERASSVADRRRAVEEFVAIHRGSARFEDEVELLEPILDGAGILYVVDGSSRFQPANEAEMDILRWTGQPGMALINRTRERDHSAEWRPILEQFFNIVREFDAHHAGFAGRVDLLRGFREIRADWRAPIDEAVGAIDEEWNARRGRAAEVMASALVESLSHVELRRLKESDDEDKVRAELNESYHEVLRRIERESRREVELVFRHDDLARSEGELEVLDHDLFSATSWRLFGLTRGQLARYAAVAGAVAGGTIDAFLGGTSFFAGAGIGALAGAGAGYFGGTEVAKSWSNSSGLARALLPGETGRFLAMGPVTGRRFPWVLTDRALLHYVAVRDRSHARRDELELAAEGKAGVVAGLTPELNKQLGKALSAVVKAAGNGSVPGDLRRQLRDALDAVMAAI